MNVVNGALRAYFLFDVADTIDLTRLRTAGGAGFERADLPLRPHTSPAYLQFPTPPLVARLSDGAFGSATVGRRVKIFDYGVVSVRLSTPFSGAWHDFIAASGAFRSNERIVTIARDTVRMLQDEIGDAFDEPHSALIEDYFISEVAEFEGGVTADALLASNANDIVTLLQGEVGTFSALQRDEALRERFSYFKDDLTVVQWDAAFIYDRPESAEATEEILEFANSQLVELRTYDALLDRELDAIYAGAARSSFRSAFGRRAAERAANLRYLIVDVLELIDRSSNALKIIGDAHYARIYRGAARRLGLEQWQNQVDRKIQSVGDVYRFFSDEARSGRDVFLEVVVIVLIATEIVLGVLALHH
ncbi:MAG: hypothetical protein JO165_03215 [Candidatus Eremiobacteraeota bacterium]|nr:hypothetical protein [Candidatus Eremiobacteraeota bacterium]